MTDGIVLAGGFSKRLGENKMNIMYQQQPVIEHTINHMQNVCNHLIVVTGHYHDEITKILKNYQDIEIVYNPQYAQGMFSSVQAGVKHVENDFFIIPGDYPLVQSKVYKKILLGTGGIRVPSFSFKLGHPIFFKYTYKEKILKTQCKDLKSFRNQYDYQIIDVDDPGILFDIDTMNDVNKLKEGM